MIAPNRETMSQKLLYLIGIVITIIFGTWLNYKFCCSSTTVSNKLDAIEQTNRKVKEVALKEPENKGFNFDSSKINFKTSDNFEFETSETVLILPISDSIDYGIIKLKETLSPISKFQIIGHFTNNEVNTSIYPNLGIARANAVKNYLVSKGITEKNLQIISEEKENITEKNGVVKNAISYKFQEVAAPEASINWTTEKKTLQANPIILYFDTAQNNIKLTSENKNKLAAFVNYIDNVPNSKISITGHTDNKGREEVNVYYSESRANFVKDYFVLNGIPSNKIQIAGKGPKTPIASNETDEGRAKNRRVEITIK